MPKIGKTFFIGKRMLRLESYIEEVFDNTYEFGDSKLLSELKATWVCTFRQGADRYTFAISESDTGCCKCYALTMTDGELVLLDELDISQYARLKNPRFTTGYIVEIFDNEKDIAVFSTPWGKFMDKKKIFGCEEVSVIDTKGSYSLWLIKDSGKLVFVDPQGQHLGFNLPPVSSNLPPEKLADFITVIFVADYSLFFIKDNLRYVWHKEQKAGVNFSANSLFEWDDVTNAFFDQNGEYAISQRKGKLFSLIDGRAWSCPSLTDKSSRFHQIGSIRVVEQMNLVSVEGYKRPLEVHEIGPPIEN